MDMSVFFRKSVIEKELAPKNYDANQLQKHPVVFATPSTIIS